MSDQERDERQGAGAGAATMEPPAEGESSGQGAAGAEATGDAAVDEADASATDAPAEPSAPDAPAGPSAAAGSAPEADAGAPPAEPAASGAVAEAAALLERLELPVEIRFGSLVWPLGKVLELRVGDALPIGPEDDDSVTLYVQGRPYAQGDLVIVDGRFAFRVSALLAEEEA